MEKNIMSILMKKPNRIFPIVVAFSLIIAILLIAGCGPRASGFIPLDAESTPISVNTPVSGSNAGTENPIDIQTNQAPEIPLTFLSDADAYVDRAEPDTNFGKK